MPQVKEHIQEYGKKKYKTDDLKKILKRLGTDGFSDQELAEKFGGTVPAIRHWKKKLGLLEPRPRFPEWVTQNGYDGLKSFFQHPKNVEKNFKQLAKETGYCYVTISYWYHIFEKENWAERG